ncbi:MAG: hypothetical protein CMN00_06485 [Rickettsiales bacterium]|nr:hypothetical protein [Rickettsiales bacterium]MAY90807.1 hypothetical protein [Rickettsiales bacterium]|tara:strand:- start:60 stop:338 length:279 start_codon:yes stop_codon:yes gene_type:complete
MDKIIRNLYLILTLFFMSCSTTDEVKYLSDCDSKTGILRAYGDTIRIEYSLNNKNEVEKIANEYCEKRFKIAKENQVNCDGCCRVTYLCKSE